MTVSYTDEQAVEVRAFPPPLSSRYGRARGATAVGDAMVVAARIHDPATWPSGWAHAVGHVDVDGVWCKLVVWDGSGEPGASVPRWLQPATAAAERALELAGEEDGLLMHDSRGEWTVGSGSLLPGAGGFNNSFSQSRSRSDRSLRSRRSTLVDRSIGYSPYLGAEDDRVAAVDCCNAAGDASPRRGGSSGYRGDVGGVSERGVGRLVSARPRRSPARNSDVSGSPTLCVATPGSDNPRRGSSARGNSSRSDSSRRRPVRRVSNGRRDAEPSLLGAFNRHFSLRRHVDQSISGMHLQRHNTVDLLFVCSVTASVLGAVERRLGYNTTRRACKRWLAVEGAEAAAAAAAVAARPEPAARGVGFVVPGGVGRGAV